MRQTSLDAFTGLVQSGKLGERQQFVFNALKTLGSATDMEITKFLGFGDPNRVRPRRFELSEKWKLIECVGERPCHVTGRLASVWRIKQ